MNKQPKFMSPDIAVVVSLLLTVGMVITGLFVPKWYGLALMVLLVFLFMVTIGVKTNGSLLGILINDRKVMSLSRVQIALWTILILSGFLFVSLQRVKDPATQNPLSFEVDWQL